MGLGKGYGAGVFGWIFWPMIALVLNIVLSVFFFHIIRSAQVKGQNMMVVAAVNYVLASSICFGLSWAEDNLAFSGSTLFWGAPPNP